MKEETRNSFELAHHHNLWRTKKELSGHELISCLAEAIRQHAFIWSVSQCEALDDCLDDLELITTALHAHKEGSLTLASRDQVDMSLAGLFHSAAEKINLRRN
tara:strand:- start:412 stop:720 length:309 start_codon:yes stop_codon:yes gene_type:complete